MVLLGLSIVAASRTRRRSWKQGTQAQDGGRAAPRAPGLEAAAGRARSGDGSGRL